MPLELQKLNLPDYDFDIKLMNSDASIYDRIRKKYVKLTPEEWVRQNFIKYLIEEKRCPQTRVRLEVSLKVNNLSKRCDAIIYDKDLNPAAILECKAPGVELNSKTLRQIGTYNIQFKVNTLIVTNGLSHFALNIDRVGNNHRIADEIPMYKDMLDSAFIP